MAKYRVIPVAVLIVLFVGVVTPQFAQDPSTDAVPSEAVNRHRALLLGLLRTINTAEATEHGTQGSYASWETLLARYPDYFSGWLKRFYSHDGNVSFADMPEVLPGYSLRLNVHADGKGYDVRLQDTSDKKWGFAAFSDESTVIWRSEPLH